MANRAFVVFDSAAADVVVPPFVSPPRADQLQGTPRERLCELAGRLCYDSTGKPRSRGTAAYHQHIAEVQHTSTLEHATFVIECHMPPCSVSRSAILLDLMNRPGVWLTRWDAGAFDESPVVRFVANLRAVVEWAKRGPACAGRRHTLAHAVYTAVAPHVPNLITHYPRPTTDRALSRPLSVVPADTLNDEELYVSVAFDGVSRNLTHELVRHRCAVSQRSTRYVDEGDTPWVYHPAMGYDARAELAAQRDAARAAYRRAYDSTYDLLVTEGVEPSRARKQARGAARGVLGGALATQLVFTAPLWWWRHIISLRASEHADAEIADVAEELRELLNSRYALAGAV